MKKIKKIFTSMACLALAACSTVPAGHKGVKVYLYGSGKGVSEEVLGVGRYWIGWNEELYLFPTFLQNWSWTKGHAIAMQTSEGLTITTEAGITYKIEPENVSKVFQKYRMGIQEITDSFLHNHVRDAKNEVASTMTIESIYGPGKEEFIKKVNKIVRDEAIKNGITVDKIYLIGSFNLPRNVVESINSKIQATQNAMRVENEVQTARAEAQKTIVDAEAHARKVLIHAESQAKANKILAESLSNEFVQYQAILRWDGKLPTTNASNAMPFINVSKP